MTRNIGPQLLKDLKEKVDLLIDVHRAIEGEIFSEISYISSVISVTVSRSNLPEKNDTNIQKIKRRYIFTKSFWTLYNMNFLFARVFLLRLLAYKTWGALEFNPSKDKKYLFSKHKKNCNSVYKNIQTICILYFHSDSSPEEKDITNKSMKAF